MRIFLGIIILLLANFKLLATTAINNPMIANSGQPELQNTIEEQADSTQIFSFQLEPRGYNPQAHTFKEHWRNFFLSKRAKKLAFQRDSLYRTLLISRKQFQDLYKKQQTDSLNQDFRNNQLQQLYNKTLTDLQQCNNLSRKRYQEWQTLNETYLKFRDSSLSMQAKLNLAMEAQEQARKRIETYAHNLEKLISRRDSLLNYLKELIKNTLISFDSSQLSVSLQEGRIYVSFSEKFLFESGSAVISNPRVSEAIDNLAEVIYTNPQLNILVEGHTDSIPIHTARFRDNWDLSVERAVAVLRLLLATNKVNPERISAAGRASFYPKASNSTAEGRALNRRTELILIPNLTELYDLIGNP